MAVLWRKIRHLLYTITLYIVFFLNAIPVKSFVVSIYEMIGIIEGTMTVESKELNLSDIVSNVDENSED